MNKQPVYYYQTDPRWKAKPYQVTGETATIGGSGCGPTCAAMLIETLTGRTFTPEDACAWSVQHGYKALNQGTFYSYFPPQFQAYGIQCRQLNSTNIYGNTNGAAAVHQKAFDLLKQGYYLIACMGKGNWTSSGHYIVAWWEDGKVKINDPASTKDARLNGDLATFKSQVKYYWAVDARAYNTESSEKEDDDVVRYAKLADIPADYGFREIVGNLMTAGIITGDGSDLKGNNDVIDLSQDMVRMLAFEYRSGVYDNALQAAGLKPGLVK